MKTRLAVAGALGTLLSSVAAADDSAAVPRAPSFGVQAQLEFLPFGSATYMQGGEGPLKDDYAATYAVSAVFDYALTSFLRIGVAPRFIFHVKDDGASTNPVDQAVDLRARLCAHYAVSAYDFYAAVVPGYETILVSDVPDRDYAGFSIGGAVGVNFNWSSSRFMNAEIGYQTAYTEIDSSDTWKLSYAHIGVGAGLRF